MVRSVSALKPIHYPTRRRVLHRVGKILQPILSRTHVTGQEYIPSSGPLIVVGNHTAFIEGLLMILSMPWPIDLIGAGDVPLHGGFVFLQQWWGFIPINRGEIDRTGLKAASTILEAGGTLGIFPEGGIWDHKIGDARLGVAYLSQQTGTPILPMGFGGLIGAVKKITHLQRPIMTVNIGPVIPAVPTSENYRERKALAQKASQQIMEAIYSLVPADDEINRLGNRQEQYAFDVQLIDERGQSVAVPPELIIPHGEDLSYFFHRPVLISVVIDNLRRPAEVLRHFDTEREPTRFAAALRETLQVFTREKPAFLSYRLGNKQAARIVEGLRRFETLSKWAAERNLSMRVRPQAIFTYADGRVERLDVPGAAHEH